MGAYQLNIDENVQSELDHLLFNSNGLLNVMPYSFFSELRQEDISGFCVRHGIYQLPTTELIDWLKNEIGDTKKCIEVGAGNGCFGRALKIPMYDNYSQNSETLQLLYSLVQQPTVKYGHDVNQMNGNKAVNLYKPDTVFASWVTQKYLPGDESKNPKIGSNMYGINELDFIGKIKKYIHVGNEKTHYQKRILTKVPVKRFYFDWLVSRSLFKENNVIYLFNFKK